MLRYKSFALIWHIKPNLEFKALLNTMEKFPYRVYFNNYSDKQK